MFENISISFQGIWSHKMRSLLTMLGIIIGIASIITIVSTIKGTNEQIKENLIGAGNNVITVSLTQNGNEYEFDYQGLPNGVSVIDEQTRAALDTLGSVQATSLFRSRSYAENIYFRNNAFNGAVYGIDSHYFSVNGYSVNAGRTFLDGDFTDRRKVAIVDATTSTKLFQGENPLGNTIEMNGEPFTVVGVVTKTGASAPTIRNMSDYELYADNSTGTVFIPESCWPIIYRYDEPQAVAVRATSTDDMTAAGKNVADSLNDTQISDMRFSYAANNLLEQAADLQELANSTNSQLIWIAGISLLVGGIGVMNIMMVSVTERTKEIGLKKAIGARRKRILAQFLTEAAVLTAIGGLLGVLSGIGLAKMLSVIMSTPAAVSLPACVIAVAFSTLIGIIFGLVPAVKASKLNPIEALNRE
ncbi:MAG: ABC transporter permease [Clostridia bacterium]|nr:ABC transporter permease [Clostridia bacterium]